MLDGQDNLADIVRSIEGMSIKMPSSLRIPISHIACSPFTRVAAGAFQPRKFNFLPFLAFPARLVRECGSRSLSLIRPAIHPSPADKHSIHDCVVSAENGGDFLSSSQLRDLFAGRFPTDYEHDVIVLKNVPRREYRRVVSAFESALKRYVSVGEKKTSSWSSIYIYKANSRLDLEMRNQPAT